VAQVYENIGHIILMLLLLGCSAFFSGSETAFFNLSQRQTNLLQKSKYKLQRLSARLLNRPRQLLSCLLFGNITVNVLFYAAASILIIRVEQQIGVTAAAITACLSLVVLVVFGEIVPKTLAYANSKSVSTAAAVPAFLFERICAPIVFLFRLLIVEPAMRLLVGPVKIGKAISTGEFKSLIEQVRKRGLITADENKLLTEIIELGFLKVRDCLRPRVDMISCAVTDTSEKACEMMLKNHLTKLPVYAGKIDNIVGMVHLRQLLLEADRPLDKVVRRVNFVPEQKTVESLLEFFRESGTDTAIVVDEYGGIAGIVRLEDIAEELLGPIEIEEGIEPIEQIGPLKYRLAGNLSIHDWAEAFGIDPGETRLSTIGGFVTALLGKIPKNSDAAQLKNLKFTVEKVRKRRIESLILTLEPIQNDD
jgi:CBS domain containing-hemolysin-like protein